MKNIILTIIFCCMCFNLAAQNAVDSAIHTDYKSYIDSTFNANLNKDQLKDSTNLDKFYFHFYEAQNYISQLDFEKAVDQLINCGQYISITANPHEAAAIEFLWYKLFLFNNKLEEARAYIQEAHALNPKNIEYLKEFAKLELNLGHIQNAIILIESLNELQPNNSTYINILANIYAQEGLYNKALKQLKIYQHLEGNSIYLLSLRTGIYQKSGHTAKAIKLIDKYISEYPEDLLPGKLLLANIYNSRNDTRSALNIYDHLNTQFPDNTSILLATADTYKNIGNDSLYEKYTFDAVNTKDLSCADAVQAIRPIMSGYLQNNDTTKVFSTYDFINSIYPEDEEVIKLKVDMFQSLKDTANMIESLYILRDLVFNEQIDFTLLSLVDTQNKTQEVINIASEGYNKFHNDNWAFYKIISLYPLNDKDSILNVSFDLLPNIQSHEIKSSIYQMIGDLYYNIDDSIAMAMYDSCLIYNPNNSGALNNVAYNITKQENPDLKLAEKLAATAFEIDPENIYILDTYAWILYLRQDYFLSEFYFDKMLRIIKEKGEQPNLECLYHIGCLYIKTNRQEQATDLWEETLLKYEQNQEDAEEEKIINIMKNYLYNK